MSRGLTRARALVRRLGRTIFGALAIVSAAALAAPEPKVTALPVANPTRILLVGNSYLYYNDSLHNHLRRMVAAADPETGKRLQYKSATIGGASLDHHNIDWLTEPGRIGVKEPFEIVVLQGHSGDALSPRGQAAFRKAASEASRIITARGGKVALYMPHAYVAPHKEANPDNVRRNAEYFVAVANELDALVIPVALAFEEAYRRHPELKLHQAYDGSHPSLQGTYLAAATCYAALYGKSPVGNGYDAFGAIDAETRLKLQRVADDTVRNFFRR